MKKVQIAEKYRREQSCSRRTEIIEGRSSTPSRAASQSIPRKRTSTVGRPWEPNEGVIQGETVTSALNEYNQCSGHINEEMTPEQCCFGCCDSQKVWEGG